MPDWILHIIGTIPAIVFPAASLVQLAAMLRRGSAEGVSVLTWMLVSFANLCLFIYTQRYDDILTIIAMLGSAALNLSVALTALTYQRRASQRL